MELKLNNQADSVTKRGDQMSGATTLRISEEILQKLSSGSSIDQILENNSSLTRKVIEESMTLAAEAIRSDVVFRIIPGTNITAEFILEELASGNTIEQIERKHSRLNRQIIQEVLAYTAQAIRSNGIKS